MKYLTIMIRDAAGNVIDIQNIKTVDAATSNVTGAESINSYNEQAAIDYLNILRTVSGLPTAHSAPSKRSSRKRVKCWMTGEIFPSAAAAARSAGCSTSYMVRRIAQRGDVKGANYEYVL